MVRNCIENFELNPLGGGFGKTKYLAWWKEGRKDGVVDGWVVAKAGLRIAYSNQKSE